MGKNDNLRKAQRAKNDEFYTQFLDVEKELAHYKEHFKNAVVLCNCNDFEWSSFWKYFHLNFETLGLKKLISTQYHETEPTHKIVYKGGKDSDITAGEITPLKQNGDFRSPECIELLKEATIICTNPPFSLFREYIAQLMEYDKKFLIIGNKNAIGYKKIFPLIKNGVIWLGIEKLNNFKTPENTIKAMGGLVRWYTNLDHSAYHKPIDLIEKYSPEKYPKYDNYDAINVNRTRDIPCDYYGVMGVPISFMDKYCPEQFEIIGISGELANPIIIDGHKKKITRFYLNKKRLYDRILIKRKLNKNECETVKHKSSFIA